MSGASAFGSASCGTFSSSTMMVMMTAITPSLKASSRALFMRRAPDLSPRSMDRARAPCKPGGRGVIALRYAFPVHAFEVRKDGHPQHPRLRGMPRLRRHLGASSPVPGMRARRLLRQLEEQARHQAFQEDRASDHHLARAGGELELVLRRRDRHRTRMTDRKSTRLNSSHPSISYAVFCLKKKDR